VQPHAPSGGLTASFDSPAYSPRPSKGIEAAIAADSKPQGKNMTTATTKSRPTHRVYAVIKNASNEKSTWLEIGAAWPHRDAKGYGVKLNLIPFSDKAEIVIRAIEPKPAAKGALKAPAKKGGTQ
jgi:hypothetical protein